MRVLFVVWGWPSHFFPLVPTAWACWTAGHDVLVASQPSLADTMRTTGLPSVSVGEDVDVMALFRRRLSPLQRQDGPITQMGRHDEVNKLGLRGPNAHVMEIYTRVAEAMTPDTVRLASEWRPDVVVWDPITFAGGIAARHVGARSVRHVWGVDITRHMGLDQEWPSALAELSARHAVAAPSIAADCSLDICPPWLQIPRAEPTVPVRYVPHNGPGEVPEWLTRQPDRARACVTWGTSTDKMTGPGSYLAPMIAESIAELDIEVVLPASPAQREALGSLPGNVKVTGWLPLNALLRSCSAIVHQGGAGTAFTAALHGVPQLAISQIHDQVLLSERLAAAGGAVHLPADQAEPASVLRSFSALLEMPAYREAAGLLRQHMLDQATLAETAQRLAEAVGASGSTAAVASG